MSKAPKLRFKEFSGDWEEDELGNIIEISKSKYNPLKNEEEYKCIELENLSQETGKLLGYFNSKEQQSIKNKFDKGKVLFGKLRPYLKKYWLADFEGVCSSEIWVLNGIKASNNFIYRLIQTDKFNFISNISSGSKMPRADWSYMREFPFFIPKLEEQEKIASFFSLIDDKISLQSEKVEALKDYKRGMMQKIFSRELRFKDDEGRDYPEWEEKKIKDIFTVTRGVVIAKNEISDLRDNINQYPVYSSQTSNNGILGYDSKYDFEGDYLTWTTDGANAGKVFRRNGKFRCTNVCGVLVEKEETLGFANKMISEFLNKETPKHVSYVGNPKLMNGVMGDIKIKVPILDEQLKIAKILDNIDLKIEKEQEKLDSLNEYKKGLLQQMFV